MRGRGSLLALAIAGLGCDDAGLRSLEGQLRVPARVDFGRVSIGVEIERALRLEATGDLPVAVHDVRVEPAGVPLDVRDVPSVLPAGAESQAWLLYQPSKEARLDARVRFSTDAGEHLVRVVGQGTADGILVRPEPLEFGWVRLGDGRVFQAEVVNRLGAPVEVGIALDGDGSPRVGGPDGVFQVRSPLGPSGRIGNGPLSPGESAKLELAFVPRQLGHAWGSVEVRYCDQPACVAPLRLSGVGTESGLRCRPSALDLGFVSPGRAASGEVVCENPTHRPLALRTAVLEGPDRDRFGVPLGPRDLPPGGEVVYPVSVVPVEEQRGRNLAARLVIEGQPPVGTLETAQVEIRAAVARAALAVVPPTVEFGEVAVDVEARQRVIVANVGDRSIRVRGATTTPPFSGAADEAVLAPGASLPIEVAIVASEAGPLDGHLEVEVDDPELDDLVVPLSARALRLPPCEVRAEPGRIDFGVAPVQSSTRRSVLLSNDAGFDCLVAEPTASGDAFAAVPLPGTGTRRLGAGDGMRLEVDFHPLRAGEHRGTLHFRVSDPLEPDREVLLTGASGEGDLRVDPSRLDFGQVQPGCAASTRSFRLLNVGAAPLEVGQIFSTSPEFTIEDGPSGVPAPPGRGLTLLGGGFVEMRVRFRPTELGEARPAVIRVEEAGALAPQIIDLVGRSAAGRAIERFHQASADAVDVLFVIDNSLSMREEQASVIANAGRFLARLASTGSDYRVAVISTDMDHPSCAGGRGTRPAGAPQGACGWFADGDDAARDPSWRVIDPSELPSPSAAFARVLNLGLDGSAREEGLAAAFRATRPNVLSGHNRDFLRPDASLAVIFVSDEEDQSPLAVEAYVAGLRSLKGASPDRVSASAVITTGVPCAYESGDRYVAVAEALGGIVRSICSQDWATVLVELAERAQGIRARFPLAQPPEAGSVEVRVDGRRVPETSAAGQRQWRVEAGTRTLIFAPAAVPPPGADIEVSYRPAC